MNKRTTTYQEDLIEALKDHREAAAYLCAAIEEGDPEVYRLALRNATEANGGKPVTPWLWRSTEMEP